MSELDALISKKISAAINEVVEMYKYKIQAEKILKEDTDNDDDTIKGVTAICAHLEMSRNTFLSLYHKGEFGKAVKQFGRTFYLKKSLLFD